MFFYLNWNVFHVKGACKGTSLITKIGNLKPKYLSLFMANSYSPPHRLWVEKNWGKRTRKITRREGSLCHMPHPILALSGGRGSTFSIFNLHAWDHYDQTSLTPCSYRQWHSWACLANIAILVQKAESCSGDYQGYHRSNVYCL